MISTFKVSTTREILDLVIAFRFRDGDRNGNITARIDNYFRGVDEHGGKRGRLGARENRGTTKARASIPRVSSRTGERKLAMIAASSRIRHQFENYPSFLGVQSNLSWDTESSMGVFTRACTTLVCHWLFF